MHLPPISHPIKALIFLITIALFPVTTSAASSKDPWKACTNIEKSCNPEIALRADSDETQESETIKTPREDDSALPKGAQPKSIPSGEFTKTVQYGHITALVDLLSFSIFGAVTAFHHDDPNIPAGIAVCGYLFGAPMTHAYYGEWRSAMISTASHLVLPVLGGYLGGALGASVNSSAPFAVFDNMAKGTLLGIFSGVATASIIDAVFLAKTTITTNEAPSLSAIPSLSVTPRGTLTFGLAGHF